MCLPGLTCFFAKDLLRMVRGRLEAAQGAACIATEANSKPSQHLAVQLQKINVVQWL